VLDDPRAHPVIEPHLAVFEVVLEMDVHGLGTDSRGDLGQGQVVGRDQADRTAVEEPAEHRLGADAPIVGIGAVKELVEQEKERQRASSQIDELADPGDLCVET